MDTPDDSSEGLGEMVPGDEAPPDHPSAAEDACPACEGTGQRDGQPCENCRGSGVVIEAIGGG